ncbi:hypothetical protein NQ314_018831 [Rhamnusium bicolor]|uniref:FAS1 domain-containing protein n=1 Tax=Rhamnusium bicolor TaxID=1586634 RepID=A0AAV8WPR6_9CUCU|nr:hypothetical protein NQ314_018831 [Rhamnusium bicolor]
MKLAIYQFPPSSDRGTQLSPQQQGQILSDIQQHHRFHIPSNQPNFQPQHFTRHHQINGQSELINQPSSNQRIQNNPQFVNQPHTSFTQPQAVFQQQSTLHFNQQQLPQQSNILNQQQYVNHHQQPVIQNKQQFAQNQFLNTLPLVNSLQQTTISTSQSQLLNQQLSPTKNPVVFPNPQLQNVNTNAVVQHHTQTNFQPNFLSQARAGVELPNPVPSVGSHQVQKPRPTIDPIVAIEQQIKSLDPEKHKQKIRELKEKQAIIEKHNQFVEKQYEKSLKKAQEDHEEFVEKQKDQKKKLYQKLYKPHEGENLHYSHTSINCKKQYKSQRIRKDDLLEQLRLAINRNPEDEPARNLSSREISLANGKKVKIIEATDPKDIPNGKEEEITLPNGEKVTVIRADNPNILHNGPLIKPEEITLPNGQTVQVIKTTDPKAVPYHNSDEPQEITLPNGQKAQLIKTTDPKLVSAASAPKATFKTEEITLPNGEKIEVIKTTDPSLVPGGVKLEPGKEQNDGTLKVQGIKGNGKDKPEIDVDSILKRIKAGEIKLPNALKPTTTTIKPEMSTNSRSVSSVTVSPNSFASDDEEEVNTKFSSAYTPTSTTIDTKASTLDTSAFTSEDDANVPILKTNIGTQILASSTSSPYTTSYSSTTQIISRSPSTYKGEYKKPTRKPHILNNTPNDLIKQASTVSSLNQNSILTNTFNSASTHLPNSTSVSLPSSSINVYQSVPTVPTTSQHPNIQPTSQTYTQQSTQPHIELPDVLKNNGLYAMAKFLKQSGLDTILNETGPYTVFVPTDKAFRTLLVQLGGPEKAEEKFKENPRLLSGLLLHHVIPGAFTIGSLQDEMTGVSLAGTQLRVNQYNMHDLEWNDVKEISYKLYNLTGRGDSLTFLRAIFASGLAETLQGSKTFTLFAPTDKAFTELSTEDLSRTVTDKILARELVLRHLLPGTLYTNGMRYYQIKDSLLQDKQLTFSKQSGKKYSIIYYHT